MQEEPITPLKEIIFNPSYTQQNGAAYLGDSLKLIKFINDNSINLIITSPPFPLTRKKEYGNENAKKYTEWFLPFADEFKIVLADNGSFVLDLGGAYLLGNSIQSI